MEEVTKHPLLSVLEMTFSKSILQDLETNYFPKTEGYKKWTCYSDYCFGDKNKPNEVVTFSFLPYINDFEELSELIKSIAQKDIKNARQVNEQYISFLKHYPLLNISFILNDKQKIFGQNATAINKSLADSLKPVKDQYLIWTENEPEKASRYKIIIKKIDRTIQQIKDRKKIKQIAEMLLVTYLGGFVSSLIVKKTQPEIFGWFSDRDAIHEVSDQLSTELFQYFLYVFSNSYNCQFATAAATSLDKPFYDELLKIPDYITGTLADYNFTENAISKDKFDTILTDYMAENTHNNFVFRILSNPEHMTCGRIFFHKKIGPTNAVALV